MPFDTTQNAFLSLRSIIGERTSGVVFWTGSGLSAEGGLPTWDQLRAVLMDALTERITQLLPVERGSLQSTARAIKNEANNWRAFRMLRHALGTATWRAIIRDSLLMSATVSPPPLYERIWRLQPHGLLTLNLDRLATKSYTDLSTGPILTEFVGRQVANFTHVLKSRNPFICQLHGNVDDASNWILTNSELEAHLSDAGYQNFIASCLSAKTIVLVGISADDVAVGGFLDRLAGLDVGAHYWFTDRRDSYTMRWAEERGIRLINYDAPDGNHVDLLEAFDDLVGYIPAEDPSDLAPIMPEGLTPSSDLLPNQDKLEAMDAESIRKALNSEATRILATHSPGAAQEYDRFSSDYDAAIYRAWYTSTSPGRNILLGHVLNEEIARGAFGRVYQAYDADGNSVAIKVLHEDIRQNLDLFHSFRRGVRSMKILSDHGVQGMVPYRKAFEIPAFVVMDLIDGPDLGEAVASMQVSEWDLILRIGSEVADIVRRGHLLPERVLHRDLRPSNVMLRGFYSDPEDWDVVVLDFDLSWHKGALEKSVTYGAALLGYLAPEQIENIRNVSTRHTAVDSFGLGMILFFMLGGRDPVPDQHLHADWKDTLFRIAGGRSCDEWQSIPTRFSRLIHYATLHEQSERWDMTQIQAELQRLLEIVVNPSSTRSAELVAEEIAFRCEFSSGYEWDPNQLSAIKTQPSGVRLEIRGDESARRVIVSASWGDPGVQGRRHLGKWIPASLENTRQILHSSGWAIEDTRTYYAHFAISASISVREALVDMPETIDNLNRAMAEVRFS